MQLPFPLPLPLPLLSSRWLSNGGTVSNGQMLADRWDGVEWSNAVSRMLSNGQLL